MASLDAAGEMKRFEAGEAPGAAGAPAAAGKGRAAAALAPPEDESLVPDVLSEWNHEADGWRRRRRTPFDRPHQAGAREDGAGAPSEACGRGRSLLDESTAEMALEKAELLAEGALRTCGLATQLEATPAAAVASGRSFSASAPLRLDASAPRPAAYLLMDSKGARSYLT
jgi:hypothetical protein